VVGWYVVELVRLEEVLKELLVSATGEIRSSMDVVFYTSTSLRVVQGRMVPGREHWKLC